MNRLTVLWIEPSTAVMNEACKCALLSQLSLVNPTSNHFCCFTGDLASSVPLCFCMRTSAWKYASLSPSSFHLLQLPAHLLSVFPGWYLTPEQCLIVRFGSYVRAQRWKSCRETPSANIWILTSSLEGYPRRLKGFLMRENLPGNCNS